MAGDLASIARVALIGVVLAAVPLSWVWLRYRGAAPAQTLRTLTLWALFLTFDLVLLGAFTRLTDSGLGCPDWPGCYGSASPLGAEAQISAAQSALPTGPVTHRKAWIEMTHRYLATAVGALITALAVMSWLQRKRNVVSPWWATATLAWVCLQGAFGALTVTMKLYPAVVSAHLLGGIALLALLAVQAQAYLRRPLAMPRRLYFATLVVLILSVLQIALGAWVSTNYAVLACSDFPTCQGSWWPVMDFEQSFVLWRELGQTSDGRWLPFATLTAIHYVHRLAAYVVLAAIALLAWSLMQLPAMRKWGWALIGVMLWQLASGLANILLGWPLLAAVAHTGGAAVLVTLLAVLVTRARQAHLSLHQAS